MKICVTGGAGMIGSTLVRRLIKEQYEVIVIDNLWRGKKEYLDEIEGFDLNSSFYNMDLSVLANQEELIEILRDTDVMIHLADIVAGIGYVFNNQYEIFRQNNLINTYTFEACAKANVQKILYVGTACSFPKELQTGVDSILEENDFFPANPESAYGWSKLYGTLELRYLKEKYDVDVCTIVLHNVYGPYCDLSERSQVIPSLIKKINEVEQNGVLNVWGSGNQGRAFVYVDDVADAFLKAITINQLPEIVQIGPNICTTIKELSEIAINISEKQISTFFDLSKPEGDTGRCANFELATNILGWYPKTDLHTGLKNTFEWVKQQK